MTKKDKKILKDAGWEVECESPLEIRRGESIATNEAAKMILIYIKHLSFDYDDRE